MKTAEQRADALVAEYVNGPDDVTLDDLALRALREHEAEVRADERAKVLRQVRGAISVVATSAGGDAPRLTAILSGFLVGLCVENI